MKKINVLIVCLLITSITFAQKGENYLKIHANAEIPLGAFGDGFKTGWGGYMTYYHGVGEEGSLLATLGVATWDDKSEYQRQGGFTIARAGYKSMLTDILYAQVDAGAAILVQDFGPATRFTFGAGPGLKIDMGSKGSVDVNARFNYMPGSSAKYTWIGLGGGYFFKL